MRKRAQKKWDKKHGILCYELESPAELLAAFGKPRGAGNGFIKNMEDAEMLFEGRSFQVVRSCLPPLYNEMTISDPETDVPLMTMSSRCRGDWVDEFPGIVRVKLPAEFT